MDLSEKSIVVMPAAHRPEFAALALERLGKANHCPKIHLNVDSGISPKLQDDFNYVWMHYAPEQCTIRWRSEHIHVTSGCWNILESIRDGYNTGAEYVFLVEEDVMMFPDAFEHHWERIGAGAIASCGRRCPMFYPRAPGIYTNPGSCLSRKLLDALIPHINDDFYKATAPYMDRVLGPVQGIHGLDDGLIRRVIWKNGWSNLVAYPMMEDPKCAHTGFQAYENHYDFCTRDDSQPIQWQIDNLRKLFKTLDRNGPKARWMKDFDVYPAELF